MKIRKKFAFATITMICVTVATIILKFEAAIYVSLVTTVLGIFTVAQSAQDHKDKHGDS